MGSDPEDRQFSLTIIAALTTGLVMAMTTVCILSYYVSSSLSMRKKLKGRPPPPPGSLGLPLIGETLHFVKHLNANTFVSFYESKQAKYGQTFKMSVLGSPTVILEPPAGNKFVFANEGKLMENSWPQSIKAILGPDSLAVKTGEDYKIVRRHVAEFLSPVTVGRYLPLAERNTLNHLAEFWQPAAGGRGDQSFELSASKLVKVLIFQLIADLCLSLQPGPEMIELHELFIVWTEGMLQLPVNLPGFAYYRSLKARRMLIDFIGTLIARRRLELKEGRARPTQDVLSGLLTQPDQNGRMNTDGELVDNILLLLFGGHDTSSSVLTMTIMYLAKYPDVRQRVKEEQDDIAASKGEGDPLKQDDLHRMKYTWQVVQESMRLQPPVVGSFRKATTDFEVNGFTILKGWKLYWNNQTCHENPRFFNQPKKFNLSRFDVSNGKLVPHTFLPFGGGPHLCLGCEIAKMELLVFLHHLVRKYTWTLIDPNEHVTRTPFPNGQKGTPLLVTKLVERVV